MRPPRDAGILAYTNMGRPAGVAGEYGKIRATRQCLIVFAAVPLSSPRRPTQCQAGVTLGLARPGGGVGIRTGHGRHALGEGPPITGGRIAKKAPHLEREADRERRPGQIGPRPAVITMNAGG
jgi:hypothetical protein